MNIQMAHTSELLVLAVIILCIASPIVRRIWSRTKQSAGRKPERIFVWCGGAKRSKIWEEPGVVRITPFNHPEAIRRGRAKLLGLPPWATWHEIGRAMSRWSYRARKVGLSPAASCSRILRAESEFKERAARLGLPATVSFNRLHRAEREIADRAAKVGLPPTVSLSDIRRAEWEESRAARTSWKRP